ncbi:MAG: hypothetical protein P1U87_19090 [Verrucomicrobiales bacterium]|nr:hypothetical protein [Verrucomicrobiales bacterium]
MRHFLALSSLSAVLTVGPAALAQLPEEPVAMKRGIPQFFIDDWLIDSRFAIKYKNNAVVHVAHSPTKHSANPVYDGDCGYVSVARHPETRKFQLWTQVHEKVEKPGGNFSSRYAIAYAESEDGLTWNAPRLGLFDWKGSKDNNIVIRGPGHARASGPQILLTLPEKDRRGFSYVMSYRTGGAGKEEDGIRLVGSKDGIHWDPDSEMRLKHLHSDTLNSIVYDADRDRYLMTCRAKDRYRRFGDTMIDTGASRRISILKSNELWTKWEGSPQALLTPDEIDAEEDFNFFYGMPMHHYAGIYWGFLWVFRMNDPIHTELVTSRDGIHWKRAPKRVPLIPLGPEGSWDDGMTFGGPHWIEVGNEWRFYYAGHDGGHDSKDRKAAIGLATCPRERLVSLRGPRNGGGVVVTRLVEWPGGDLFLNAAPAGEGEARITVRVSDAIRDPVSGYEHSDCQMLSGDAIRHPVTWKGGKSMADFEGQAIRLEIFLENADLFTIVAE